MALAIHDRPRLIYRERPVDVSLGNGYFPWEPASGDNRMQEAKNIFVRGDYRCKIWREQDFEMLN